MSIATNLSDIRQRISDCCAKYGRSADEVTLIAVSKTHPSECVNEAMQAGQFHFGENRVQEMLAKSQMVMPGAQWHMIGTLQTNKIRLMAPFVHWIHSVPSIAALDEISKRAIQHQRIINVLIQVNISDEDQKSGCDEDQLAPILKHAATLPGLEVHGLMGMASFVNDSALIRSQFAHLRLLRDEHKYLESPNIYMRELSMGMSQDLEEAIAEGATMVRIGTAIFGQR
jgi:hypothetical protein